MILEQYCQLNHVPHILLVLMKQNLTALILFLIIHNLYSQRFAQHQGYALVLLLAYLDPLLRGYGSFHCKNQTQISPLSVFEMLLQDQVR